MSQQTRRPGHRVTQGFRTALACTAAVLGVMTAPAWAQSSAPVDTTKIVIGENNTGTGPLPIYIALQQGFFKKAGVDVEVQMLSGGTPSAMAAFANGSVNMLTLSAPEVVEYAGNKVMAGKAFGELIDQIFDVVAAKSITSMQQMKGSTIGISGPNSADWIFFIALLQHYGIDPKDVTFITTGNPVSRIAAMAAGTIQFATTANNLRPQASAVGNILLKSGDAPAQFPATMIIGNNDLLANHKPLLKKFLAAVSEGVSWMQANPEPAAAECAKVSGAKVEDCRNLLTFSFDRTLTSPYTWSSTSGINVDGVKSAIAVMNTIQADTKGLTFDDVVDTSLAGTTP